MIRRMVMTTTIAAALAFSPVASTKAVADSDDVAKLLLGAIVVGVAVNAIKKRRDREASRSDHNPARDWPTDPWNNYRNLPAECAFETRTHHGWSNVFGQRCLERQGVRAERLPSYCAFEIRTNRGPRTVYGETCLSDHGYTVEARRR